MRTPRWWRQTTVCSIALPLFMLAGSEGLGLPAVSEGPGLQVDGVAVDHISGDCQLDRRCTGQRIDDERE